MTTTKTTTNNGKAEDRVNNRILIYFLITLGVIAILLWSVFLVQILKQTDILTKNQNIVLENQDNSRKILDYLTTSRTEHDIITKLSKFASETNLNLTKINAKNIENILNNITEINKKLK